jgi:hypothetical protein
LKLFQPHRDFYRLAIKTPLDMIRKLYFLSLALAMLLGWSCEQNELLQNEDQCRPILQDKAFYNSSSKEPDAVIKQAYQIENCLVLEVTYGGGCTEQVPSLVWDGSLGKSLPPLTPLKLNFPKDDPCEALITKTYYFDLLAFFTATGYDKIRLALPGLKQELIVEKQ